MQRLISSLFLAAITMAAAAHAAQPGSPKVFFISPGETFVDGDKGSAQRDPVYADGMKAMDESRWSDAVKEFDKVVAAHGDRAEAALYWKAYSLEKLGRKDEARSTCDQLHQQRPASSWNRECVMLRVQAGVDLASLKVLTGPATSFSISGQGLDPLIQEQIVGVGPARYTTYRGWYDGKSEPHNPEDDLKLIALNSLLQQEPSRAIPLLRSVIFSNKPMSLRRHALFIVGRGKSPEAQVLLTEVASSKTDLELQRAAVQILATARGKQAGPALQNIYRNSADKGVKRAALSGLYIARDASGLVDLARSEKDVDLKREIVSQLAVMHDPAATAYMEELLK